MMVLFNDVSFLLNRNCDKLRDLSEYEILYLQQNYTPRFKNINEFEFHKYSERLYFYIALLSES